MSQGLALVRSVLRRASVLPVLAAAAWLATSAPVLAAAPGPGRLGPGSLAGVWADVGFSPVKEDFAAKSVAYVTADGGPIPLQPWAAKLLTERRTGLQTGKPFARNSARCLPQGMPDAAGTPAQLPIQILEAPRQITILYELLTTFRLIRMNQPHDPDPDPTFNGDAVGHWDHGTLVIDTIAISDQTTILELIPHTDALHVVERLRRTGADTMEDEVTLDDPKAFTRPWKMLKSFKRVPGMRIEEFYCEEDRNPPVKGVSGVALEGK